MAAKKIPDCQLRGLLAEYAYHPSERTERTIAGLKNAIMQGEVTTGDLARDLVFANRGTIDEKIEAPIRAILVNARPKSLFLLSVFGPMTYVDTMFLDGIENEVVRIHKLVADRDFRPAFQSSYTDFFYRLMHFGFVTEKPSVNMVSGTVKLPFERSYLIRSSCVSLQLEKVKGNLDYEIDFFDSPKGTRTAQGFPAQNNIGFCINSGCEADQILKKDERIKGQYFLALSDMGMMPLYGPRSCIANDSEMQKHEVFAGIKVMHDKEQDLQMKLGMTRGAARKSVLRALGRTGIDLRYLLNQAVRLGLDRNGALSHNEDACQYVRSLCRSHSILGYGQ